ncbi:MAG: ATP-binding protein [Candidatus Edwardsbacteria bacterium]
MEINAIIGLNPWWKQGQNFVSFDVTLKALRESFLEFHRRSLEFEQNKIYIIRGPRQSGKTSWIKQNIQQLIQKKFPPRGICYLSCDRLTAGTRAEFRNALDFFISQSREQDMVYLFLDEITYVKEWGYELKSLVDAGTLAKFVVVATGSNPALIRREAELMPGRGISGNEFYLKPLTFRDFCLQLSERIAGFFPTSNQMMTSLPNLADRIAKLNFGLEDMQEFLRGINEVLPFKEELDYLFSLYLLTGGFPKAINDYLNNKFNNKKEKIQQDIYEDLIRTISGDIQKQGKGERIAKQILFGILKRIGTRYSYISLAKETEEGITQPTVTDYLNLFEESFLLNTLYAYDFEQKFYRPKAPKKIYFSDLFLFYAVKCWIESKEGFEVSQEMLQDEGLPGKVVEGIIAQHLALAKEQPLLKPLNSFLWFYYNGNKEIDFVYKKESGEYIGVELKYQRTVIEKDFYRISNLSENILLTRDELNLENKVLCIPIVLFLSLLQRSEKNL